MVAFKQWENLWRSAITSSTDYWEIVCGISLLNNHKVFGYISEIIELKKADFFTFLTWWIEKLRYFNAYRFSKRRGGWVAESNGLLNRRRGNSTEGSNPSLSAIFYSLNQSQFVQHPLKPDDTKGFTNFYPVRSKHTQTSGPDRFSGKNPLFSVWILRIPGKPQKLELVHNSFIINNNAFLYYTEPRWR